MLYVRDYRPEDLTQTGAVCEAAFGTPLAPSDIARFAQEPHLLLVAVEDENVTGMAGATRFGSAAYVGPMAVDPGRQRRGIGRRLLAEVIARLEAAGVTSMSLEASEAGRPLYEVCGFELVEMTTVFARETTASARRETSDEAENDERLLASALDLDKSAYGYDRSALFKAYLAMDARAQILLSDGGYAFARSKVLGPWVATSERDATLLLDLALRKQPSIQNIFVPAGNPHAIRLVTASRFHEVDRVTHMTRGAKRINRQRVYGLASPTFG